jgi:hypothetical protein
MVTTRMKMKVKTGDSSMKVKSIVFLALLGQVQRNWFRIYRLTTMIVIGLKKPYTKLESGTNLVLKYDVY